MPEPLTHLLSAADADTTRVPAAWARGVGRIHFVGVGGAGMGGIAEVLHTLGFTVSGSDASAGNMTRHLERLGVTVHVGHDPSHVAGCGLLVRSTAIADDNPELAAARAAHVPIVPRAQMLAEIASGVNARLGAGRYLVAEADESDASFLLLQPVMSVVTNIDADHMETYGGDFARLKATFLEFLHHLPFYGRAVLCADDPTVAELIPAIAKPVVTYGLGDDADIRARDIRPDGMRTHFVVENGSAPALPVTLNLPGLHNVRNALAAVAVARLVGVDDAALARGLAGFQGIARRLQDFGERVCAAGAVRLVDDYAHHPREVAATLQAARAAWPARRVVAVFQPHRYSRLRDLMDDFAAALSEADALVVTEVYAAGEEPLAVADGRALCRAIRGRGRVEPVFAESLQDLPDLLPGLLAGDDVLLTLGAGDIGGVPPVLAAAWPAAEGAS